MRPGVIFELRWSARIPPARPKQRTVIAVGPETCRHEAAMTFMAAAGAMRGQSEC